MADAVHEREKKSNNSMDSNGALSQKEVKEWKASYRNLKVIEEEINIQCLSYNEKIDKLQLKFSPSLAVLCQGKDDDSVFKGLHNKQYRWVWMYNYIFPTPLDACRVVEKMEQMKRRYEEEEEEGSPLSNGWRWMLQIKTRDPKKGDQWWDWVYIQQSAVKKANLGLFTGRDFPRGSILGYHVGRVTFQAEDPTAARPTDADLDKEGVPCTPYTITVRDKKACWRVIDPVPVQHQDEAEKEGVAVQALAALAGESEALKFAGGAPLHMGMHYMNNACETYREGTVLHEKAKKKQNCYITDEGGVQVTKKVPKDTELFTPYNSNERIVDGGIRTRDPWSARLLC